uniref:Alcohol dehydrogenase, putative n=1 Tax=Entamoeba histolytica TaxID=5759 RepID=S0B069_ENTHI|nr:alcohol dehydrogenase, putative [Entamoeba histolytica]
MNTFSNFIFQSPTILCYGKGACSEIEKKELIPKGARVMMLYGGGSIKKNGVYEEVKKYVKPIVEFGGIEPNPAHETCMKAVKIAKENNIDFLLAVGGGSVIDGTKYIALAMGWTATEDPFDMFTQMEKANAPKSKIGVVLTIPATGTETNNLFVVTNYGKKDKALGCNDLVKPYFAIVDPCHSFTLPKNQVINGVIDSYVHVIEQYIGHYDSSAVVDRFCEGILKVITTAGPKTIEEPTNYKYRADFCLAATYALNGILATGIQQCWAAHMIGHEVTTYYGVAHGASLAMTCPGVMRFNKEKNAKKLAQLAERVFGIENATAEDGINCTIKFFESVGGITRMSKYNFDHSHVEEIASKFKGRTIGAHHDISYEEVKTILNDIF